MPVLFRQGGGFLDGDRKTCIRKNRKRLQEQVDIQGEMLLDVLLERGVITSRNKQVIEVGLAYRPNALFFHIQRYHMIGNIDVNIITAQRMLMLMWDRHANLNNF